MWSTGASTDSITVTSSGSYNLMFNDGTGCGLQQSNTITVTVDTLPTPSISGSLGICPGGGNSTTLDAGAGYVSYLWTNLSSTQTIDVSIPGSHAVTVEDGNGCTGTAPEVITFFSQPPMPVISGNLSFCPGDSTELDAGVFTTYTWSTGGTTDKIYVKTPQTVSVTVTDASGCTGSSSNVNVTHHSTTTPSISGAGGFCPGFATTLTASTGFADYSWSTGSMAQSINVSTIGTYSVTATDANGCKTSSSKNIVAFVPPKPFIAGALSFCGGSSVQLKAVDVSGSGFISYSWSTGQTSQSIFADSADTYSVTVTDINGCVGDTNAIVVEEGAVPDSPGEITGPAFMPGDSSLLIYSITPVSNTLFYHWIFPDGVSIVGKGDSTVIVVTIDSIPIGPISVGAANGCGLSPYSLGGGMAFEPPTRGDCNQANFVVDNSPIATGIYIGNSISSAGTVAEKGLVLFRPKTNANLNANFNVELGAILKWKLPIAIEYDR